MKKIITLIALLLSLSAMAQTLSPTKKLETTARIWGLLKYYHPQVAAGKFNWDEQLVQLLPQVEKAQTKEELSNLYLTWIDGLGAVPLCKKCEKANKGNFDKNFNMGWMQDASVFTEALTAKLKYIEANRLLGTKYYAGTEGTNNVKITNEKEYKDFEYPAEQYRLMSLYRYWNIVEYFYPYKYKTGQKWDDVLTEMIPKFKNAKDAKQYQLAMLELVVKIDDSHGYLVSKEIKAYFGDYWAPFKFSIIDDKAVVTGFYSDSLAQKDDIRIGDAISHVDGVPVAAIFKEKSPYIPASNPAIKKRNAYASIFNGSTDNATITLERHGKTTNKQIARYLRDRFKKPANDAVPASEKYRMLDNNIGYVNMGVLTADDINDMYKTVANSKAIVFDVRNYPKGTIYMIMGNLLANQRAFVKSTEPYMDYPGKFYWSKDYKIGRKKNNDPYKGKIIVLVNEQTQSHAEFTAMGFQAADNVTVIGSQTAGADGNVSQFEFPGGFETMITGLGVYYPDGRETQRVGIVPHIEVHPTIAGIRAGRDEVLEKALEVARK